MLSREIKLYIQQFMDCLTRIRKEILCLENKWKTLAGKNFILVNRTSRYAWSYFNEYDSY